MNRLEELIKEKCPNGVEFKKLSECCNILDNRRKPVTKSVREKGIYPYYGANGIQDYVSNYIFDGTFMLVGEDGSVITASGNPIVNWAEGKIWVNNHAHIVEEIEGVLLRYLYYYMQSVNVRDLIHGNIPKLNQGDFRNIMIAVPPIEIQQEIVRILDNFSKLSMELSEQLSKELKARKKQYEYYRDELLLFKNEKYPQMKLADIATDMYRGAGIKRTEVTEDGISCVRYGEIYTTYNIIFDKCVSHTNENMISSKKYFEYGDILFAITGESVEEIGKSIVYLGNDKCLAGGDTVVMKHNQNPKYMAYILSTTMAQEQKSKGKVKSKVVHSSVPALKEISIPIPPLEIQGKIANILEKFYKLCNDISSGLLAEIEARRKQYEYYRNKLLTFKELKTV